MAFTILFAGLSLLILGITFGVTYFLKGRKFALIVKGTVFILLVATLVVSIGIIVSSMPN
jgi:hypothetical protein